MLLGALLFAGASAAQAVPLPPAPPSKPPALPGPPKPPGSPADTSAADSTKPKKDSVETPFAQAEMPQLLEIGESFTWDRAALFNTGALTLIGVLDRVPGLTVYASGWIGSPQYAAYLGNPARLRIFWDGAELIALGNSASSPLDLASVPIWSVQEMSLERGADEVRIYIRSWNLTRTTVQSRVDIVTGDLGTNMLRGYFGTRFQNGMGLQFGGQVSGTSSDVTIGGGSQYDLLLRFGWARGRWSTEAFIQRGSGSRYPQIATTIPIYVNPALARGIPGETGKRTIAYLRGGVGQPDSGRWWGQLILSQQQVSQQLLSSLATTYVPLDSLPVTRTATQLVAAGGFSAGALRVSASARNRWLPLGTSLGYTARASLPSRFVSLSLFTDQVIDSGGISDLALKITPTSYLAIEGAVGYRTAPDSLGGNGVSGRLLVGGRLGRVWIQAGALRRDATVVPGLVAYDTAYKSATSAAATGPFISIRGKVVEDVGINVWAVRWNAVGFYRPQLQSRAEVFLDTQWLKRFPTGHFGLHAAFGDEYRSDVLFPIAGSKEVLNDPLAVVAFNSNVLYANVEVRILDATIYFTAHWGLTPRPYELVPQYLQPVQVYTYGLRWNFWN